MKTGKVCVVLLAPAPTPACFLSDVKTVTAPRIVVHKSLRTLEVYDGKTLVARARISLGSNPAGPKLQEGDGKTPEGAYYICTRNEKSNYHMSFGLSYPNTLDAKKGLDAGLIDKEQYDGITSAYARRKRPPWNTPLGGEIMIHGGGTDGDWTAGCIGLDQDSMVYLWKFIEIGTEVEIQP